MDIFTHARIFTGGKDATFLNDGALCIEQDRIVAVGPTKELVTQYPTATPHDLQNRLVLPGFVCAHTHFYGMYARGMGLKDEPPTTFKEILERLWWRLDKALEHEDSAVSAEVFLGQAIRCGTTTIIDHHASPNAIAGSLDYIAAATTAAGVRASLCYEVTDRNGPKGTDDGIEENIRFITKVYKEGNPLLGAAFGIHAPFTVSDETLAKCVTAMNQVVLDVPQAKGKTGFHLHVAEDGTDGEDSLKRCGKRTLHRLEEAGLLTPTTLAAHCVKVDEAEKEVIHRTGIQVVHNPQSNMNNAVGVSDVLGLLKRGVCVGLGTDGMTFDMIAESKVNYLIHKLEAKDPRVMGSETIQMLSENNSTIASRFFKRKVGVLEPNAFADFIVVEYDPPTPLNAGNFPWHMQFGLSSFMVRDTVVGGKYLMKDTKLLTIDEARVMERARAQCEGVWSRF